MSTILGAMFLTMRGSRGVPGSVAIIHFRRAKWLILGSERKVHSAPDRKIKNGIRGRARVGEQRLVPALVPSSIYDSRIENYWDVPKPTSQRRSQISSMVPHSRPRSTGLVTGGRAVCLRGYGRASCAFLKDQRVSEYGNGFDERTSFGIVLLTLFVPAEGPVGVIRVIVPGRIAGEGPAALQRLFPRT